MQAKRPGECRPCKCPQDPPRCKMSRTVKDGCDCCHVCPRQQGDLCDYRYLCDDRRLYCDFNVDGGHRGICRGRHSAIFVSENCSGCSFSYYYSNSISTAREAQYLPTPHAFDAPVEVTLLEFRSDFCDRKLRSLGYRSALFARSYV